MDTISAAPGSVRWMDLTVSNVEEIRRFYESVAGWRAEAVDMGGYMDYSMLSADGEVVAGLCHARGGNVHRPSQWLIYITVSDIEKSTADCKRLGGKVLSGPSHGGSGHFSLIQDPAGAMAMLWQPHQLDLPPAEEVVPP